MSIAVRLVAAAVVALLAACSRDLSNKNLCNVDTDCIPGYFCINNRCGRGIGGGGTGGGGTGGSGGNTGTFDGGLDLIPPRMCPTSLVNACPAADAGNSCAQTFCGGRLWQNGVLRSVLVLYRIYDQNGMFPESYRGAIRASANAWSRATGMYVVFKECIVCTGRFISVVPGNGDGISNPDEMEQLLPMPTVATGGRVSPHRIAHQLGHALGLSHTYQRADRDRYMGFDPDIWCPPGGSGLPPQCAAGAAGPPGLPAVTTGTFGVFDGKSKMNGLPSEGICGAEEPDEDSGEPTIGDLSAMAELFHGAASQWSPFRPIGRSVSPTQPLDYQLAPGVDPTGSPQIAEITYASPEIFVRGTDDRVYATTRTDLSSSTAQWADWTQVAEHVDADPAVVFSWLTNPETLFLAVRSQQDAQIHLRSRRGGTWGDWTSLAAPPAGAASAPALASQSPSRLAVLVRGGDGLIYWLDCTDAQNDCAASASQPAAWTALRPPPSGIFVGKPSTYWALDTTGLVIAAIRDDRKALYMTDVATGGSDWAVADNISADLAPDDPDPGVAIALLGTPGDVSFFARNRQGLLVSDTVTLTYYPIGGVLVSPPTVAAIYSGAIRTDVAAIIDDHGHPGVWWRYNDMNYRPPCHYNQPGTCLQCGL
jgi:hypothetical protein